MVGEDAVELGVRQRQQVGASESVVERIGEAEALVPVGLLGRRVAAAREPRVEERGQRGVRPGRSERRRQRHRGRGPAGVGGAEPRREGADGTRVSLRRLQIEGVLSPALVRGPSGGPPGRGHPMPNRRPPRGPRGGLGPAQRPRPVLRRILGAEREVEVRLQRPTPVPHPFSVSPLQRPLFRFQTPLLPFSQAQLLVQLGRQQLERRVQTQLRQGPQTQSWLRLRGPHSLGVSMGGGRRRENEGVAAEDEGAGDAASAAARLQVIGPAPQTQEAMGLLTFTLTFLALFILLYSLPSYTHSNSLNV